MTKQEYKDLLIKSALDGTFPSVGTYIAPNGEEKKACMYRGPGGKKCAAGLLIPDDKFEPAWNNKKLWGGMIIDTIQMPEGMTSEDIIAVQQIHDDLAMSNDGIEWTAEKFIELVNTSYIFDGCT